MKKRLEKIRPLKRRYKSVDNMVKHLCSKTFQKKWAQDLWPPFKVRHAVEAIAAWRWLDKNLAGVELSLVSNKRSLCRWRVVNVGLKHVSSGKTPLEAARKAMKAEKRK